MPVEALGDGAADERTDGDGETGDAAPRTERDRASLRRHRRGQDRQGQRRHDRATDALDGAGEDEDVGRRRQRGERTCPPWFGSISPAGCGSTSSSTGATGSTRPTRRSARSPAASWRAASSSSDAALFDARRLQHQIVFALEFRGRAGAEPGAPHLRRARSAAPSQALRAVLGAGGIAATVETLEGETAVLDSRVERFPDGSFVEDGTITYGSAGAITFVTVGRGHVGPSPRTGWVHGAVIWQVTGGDGRFAGARARDVVVHGRARRRRD